MKYGKLTVLSTEMKGRKRFAFVRCDCGVTKEVRMDNILQGTTISCGCHNRERNQTYSRLSQLKHGLRYHPIYIIWKGMKARCYNKNNPRYKDYGGRGIIVCAEWLNNPKSFYDWAISNGWKEGLEIDRSENEGIYEPGNCRFVSPLINNGNRRCSLKFNIDGIERTLKDLAKIYSIKYSTLYARLTCRNMTIYEAINCK